MISVRFAIHAARSLVLPALLCGCGGETSGPESSDPRVPPSPVASVDTAEPSITPEALRRRLKLGDGGMIEQRGGRLVAVDLRGTEVTDLGPLAGLPLAYLDVTGLPISDLSPLAGMPLEKLYLVSTMVENIEVVRDMPLDVLWLNHTLVSDLTPLTGKRLSELNLYGTPIPDLRQLAGVEMSTLWLCGTPVSDLKLLTDKSLVSLDIADTPVSDIRVLSGMASLKRLNVAGSQVTDLAPIAGLSLDRLVFTPSRITSGLDVARNMPTLQQLGVRFDEPGDLHPANEFWTKYDAGEFDTP